MGTFYNTQNTVKLPDNKRQIKFSKFKNQAKANQTNLNSTAPFKDLGKNSIKCCYIN